MSTLTRDEILLLEGAELSAAVAREVMGWQQPTKGDRTSLVLTRAWISPDGTMTGYCAAIGDNQWRPHSDARHCREAEQAVAARGLFNPYLCQLAGLLEVCPQANPMIDDSWEIPSDDLQKVMMAPLDAKCRAMILAATQ